MPPGWRRRPKRGSPGWKAVSGFSTRSRSFAPLLGLFGTVLGMISAFQALQEAGSQVDPSILAGGIWVALLTTAVGLAVAMPTSVVLSWLEARMDADRVLAQKAVRTVLAPENRGTTLAPEGVPAHA